jgi:hypothetical protein
VGCATCLATFAALETHESTKERAARLDELEPNCRCQAVSVSEHSPGCVGDGEALIRILVAPQHTNKNGHPRAASLADAERGGLSVFREHLALDEDILIIARELVGKARAIQGKKAGVSGVLRIECNTLRSFCLHPENEPCYCVYDTALQNRRSHAEAFQRVAGLSAGVADTRRAALFDRIKACFIPVDEFRGGLLKSLAPERGS